MCKDSTLFRNYHHSLTLFKKKITNTPSHNKKSPFLGKGFGVGSISFFFYDKNPNSAPAATAEPMTPATLGPMACMMRKLWRSYSSPML